MNTSFSTPSRLTTCRESCVSQSISRSTSRSIEFAFTSPRTLAVAMCVRSGSWGAAGAASSTGERSNHCNNTIQSADTQGSIAMPSQNLNQQGDSVMVNSHLRRRVAASSVMRAVSILPSITSWNARGLLATEPKLAKRKLAVAQVLLSRCVVLGIQESHGDALLAARVLPRSHVYFSSVAARSRVGGIITAIKKTWLDGTRVQQDAAIPGRLLIIRLELSCGITIAFYNVHVEQTDNMTQLEVLCDIVARAEDERCDLCILHGDMNFDWDAKSSSHGTLRRHFVQAATRFCCIDVAVPTCYSQGIEHASTIDHFYLSIPAEVAILARLSCSVVPVASFLDAENRIARGPLRPSDHVPIQLHVETHREPCKGTQTRCIPSAVCQSSLWCDEIKHVFTKEYVSQYTSFDALSRLPRDLHRIAREALHQCQLVEPQHKELNLLLAHNGRNALANSNMQNRRVRT
eukprot:2443932-Amphidinium_carterae.1